MLVYAKLLKQMIKELGNNYRSIEDNHDAIKEVFKEKPD